MPLPPPDREAIIFAILAAALFAIDALRDGLQAKDLFEFALAAWALHFGLGVGVPWRRA